MSPYRTSPGRAQHDVDSAAPNDDRVLGVLLLLIGGVRVTAAVARHEVFATESTIALFMVALAIGLLLARS